MAIVTFHAEFITPGSETSVVPPGPTSFPVGRCPTLEVADIVVNIDELKLHPNAPAWIKDWQGNGHFTIEYVSNAIAHFNPQAWVNDYAVPADAEGPTDFYVGKIADDVDDDDYPSDELRDHPNAPQWVKD